MVGLHVLAQQSLPQVKVGLQLALRVRRHRGGLWVSGFFARALLAGLAILKRTAGGGEAPDGGAASAFSAIVAIN